MAAFDINKYRDLFNEEAEELFETIDSLLLDAEETGDMSNEEINSLFRAVHTLKGNSASVELVRFAALAHELEFFMDKLRNGELAFELEMAGLLMEGMDKLKEILAIELDGEISDEEFKNLTEEILEKVSAYSVPVPPLSEAEVTQEIIHHVPKGDSTAEFGLIDPSNEMCDFGLVGSSPNGCPPHHTLSQASTPSQDDDFGFFDDEAVATPSAASSLILSQSSESDFGFFDDEPLESSQPSVAVAKDDDDFGFFDDAPRSLSTPAPLVASPSEEDDFGFFDDMPQTAVTQPSIAAVKEEDDFGFFDDMPHQAPSQSSTPVVATPEKPIAKEVVAPVVAATVSPVANKDKESDATKRTKTDGGSNSIRVDLVKIDGLMNNIGELVIAHSMLSQYVGSVVDPKIKNDLAERLDLIDRHIRELQESVMSVRMVPMETVFAKFPKMIRDTAKKLNKVIEFRHFGETVEIDKAMIEGLTDPLTHIVRNALDHGIESPSVRKSNGKSEAGTLIMGAEQANGQMIIKIQDDGGGIKLDRVVAKALANNVIDANQAASMSKEEKALLIFAPGLSTADAVTDISGRGVGMDVVMSNIKKLGGVVNVETDEGIGTTFQIALPLTLAILDGLNVRIGESHFILPLSAIIESLKPTPDMIKQVGDGQSEILMLRSEFIPVVRLHNIFGITPSNHALSDGILIVVRSATQKIALFVDEFMNQQQFVIKPLDKNFRNARGIGGATVRGDGTIGLIIDTMNLVEKSY